MSFGLGAAKKVMITFLVLAVIAIAIILAMTSLNNAGIFATGSAGANQTAAITGNVSAGVVTLFSFSNVIFTIIAVVILIALISLLILYVEGIGGGEDRRNEGGL